MKDDDSSLSINTMQALMAGSFALTCVFIGLISKLVDHRLIFSSSFVLMAGSLFTLDRHEQHVCWLNYLAVCLAGCSFAAILVPTVPELISAMKTELRIESEKQGSILTEQIASPDNEEGTVRTSELIKPTALFSIQME